MSNVVYLDERRAMQSLTQLIILAMDRPGAALNLINRLADTEEQFPHEASVYFTLGYLQGALIAQATSPGRAIEMVSQVIPAEVGDTIRPADYIGNKRVFGRTGLPTDPGPGGTA